MVINKDIHAVIVELARYSRTQLTLYRSVIDIQISLVEKKLSFTTSVYEGDHYIPPAVREAVRKQASFFPGELYCTLHTKESEFAVYLCFTKVTEEFSNKELIDLLEEFADQAERWRDHLEELDHNDTIWVKK